MMNQMMGGSSISGTQAMPQYVWGLVVVFIIIAALGVVGAVYYLIYPEIRQSPVSTSVQQTPTVSLPTNETVSQSVKEDKPSPTSWPVLIKTSKPDEKKVLEVLAAHGGKYLQKLVVKESGLSKLKTHRIVSRFAERGIITVTKSGNTNEIALADWLHQGSAN